MCSKDWRGEFKRVVAFKLNLSFHSAVRLYMHPAAAYSIITYCNLTTEEEVPVRPVVDLGNMMNVQVCRDQVRALIGART